MFRLVCCDLVGVVAVVGVSLLLLSLSFGLFLVGAIISGTTSSYFCGTVEMLMNLVGFLSLLAPVSMIFSKLRLLMFAPSRYSSSSTSFSSKNFSGIGTRFFFF